MTFRFCIDLSALAEEAICYGTGIALFCGAIGGFFALFSVAVAALAGGEVGASLDLFMIIGLSSLSFGAVNGLIYYTGDGVFKESPAERRLLEKESGGEWKRGISFGSMDMSIRAVPLGDREIAEEREEGRHSEGFEAELPLAETPPAETPPAETPTAETPTAETDRSEIYEAFYREALEEEQKRDERRGFSFRE